MTPLAADTAGFALRSVTRWAPGGVVTGARSWGAQPLPAKKAPGRTQRHTETQTGKCTRNTEKQEAAGVQQEALLCH